MNDTDLARAYARLADDVTPPPDAAARVADRVAQRRRRRASGYAALAVLVVLGVGGVAAEVRPGGGDAEPAGGPRASDTSSPSADDLALTCPDGEPRRVGSADPVGSERFTDLLREHADGPFVVDRDARRLSLVRPDGTAHTTRTWTERDGRYHAEGYVECTDAARWRGRDIEPDGAVRVRLAVGHCWIEPLRVGGRDYDVVAGDQLGWGGGKPAGFRGRGVVWPAGDVLVYRDDSSTLLTLVPVGDPWALPEPRPLCR